MERPESSGWTSARRSVNQFADLLEQLVLRPLRVVIGTFASESRRRPTEQLLLPLADQNGMHPVPMPDLSQALLLLRGLQRHSRLELWGISLRVLLAHGQLPSYRSCLKTQRSRWSRKWGPLHSGKRISASGVQG